MKPEIYICSNAKNCSLDCPHKQPHEHRDDCCEADCYVNQVKCEIQNED
jgi:hypothetical protein